MTSFANDLQFVSIVVHEEEIYVVIMILGPRQSGNDINVCLKLLIDDLKLLWEEGVDVYDSYSQELFCLRAMLFCTINDFPAYENLSDYNVKGHFACPIYEKKTRVIFNCMVKKLCIQNIDNSFLEIILTIECKKHLMEVLRMKL